MNPAHLLFEKHLTELGLVFMREWRFHPQRKWRFDFLVNHHGNGKMKMVTSQFAVEIEGAIYAQGRHTRGAGYQKDLDKYNHATAMGFKVFRFSTTDVLRGRAKAFLQEHLLKG